MNFRNECVEELKLPRIVCEEKRSKITFLNNKRNKITKIQIDKCVITEGVRCDWLLIDENKCEYFVELKGSDVKHAIDQLTATIQNVSENSKTVDKMSFVISRRCPLDSTEIGKHKRLFRKNFNSELVVRNSPCEHKLN